MTDATPDEVVLVSGCVILRAFDELVRGGTPDLDPFPPADPATPAASALSTGASHRVDNAGFRMVLDERTLTQALKQLQSGVAAPRFADIVQYWEPDFVIASDARVVARFEDERCVFRPSAWVRNCIAVIR